MIYAESAAQGLSVIEAAPNSEAAREIVLLGKAVLSPVAQKAVVKTINFKTRKPTTADDWVQSASALPEQAPTPAPAVPMKRLTIDVSEDLHTRVKLECTRRKLKIADVVRALLEREFP